jgi:perosamine synthetase
VDTIEPLLNSRTKAILITHLYGQPVDMNPIIELGRAKNVLVLEDAAEAIGATYNGKVVGSLADGAIFSLFGNKTMTTGEGGVVISPTLEHKKNIELLKGQGMNPHKRYFHEILGYNYRITNLQCAIGLAQSERLNEFLIARKRIFERYRSNLRNKVQIQGNLPSNAEHGHWLFSIVTENNVNRDSLVKELAKRNIETRPFFVPTNEFPYIKTEDQTPVSSKLSKNGLSLPTYPSLTNDEIDEISDIVLEFIYP